MDKASVHATHPDREGIVDLRSDTLTQPTPEMRQAMAAAPVGDDLLGEDPSVHKLEQTAAKILGKKAALFLPSGSMANLAAILAHTGGRAEVIAESRSHILHYEAGSHATLGGCPVRSIHAEKGVYTPEQLQDQIKPKGFLFTPQRLAVIENTANGWGGTLWQQKEVDAVAKTAHDNGLKIHCDGARLFNAAAALKTDPARLVKSCDSVMVSLSKGLSAPVGSVLAGDKDFIEQARGARKALGGAMRQSGVLAAAGQVALETMRERLREDHEAAKRLAQGLHELGYGIDPDAHPTNILLVDPTPAGFTDAASWTQAIGKEGILAFPFSKQEVRLVTHRHVTPERADQAIGVFDKSRRS